jgi:hypothetical protein
MGDALDSAAYGAVRLLRPTLRGDVLYQHAFKAYETGKRGVPPDKLMVSKLGQPKVLQALTDIANSCCSTPKGLTAKVDKHLKSLVRTNHTSCSF